MAVEEDERSINELILDALILRQIYTLRFASHLKLRLIRILDSDEDDIGRLIRDEMSQVVPGQMDAMGWLRITALADRIQSLRRVRWEQVRNETVSQLDQFGQAEVTATQRIYGSGLPVEYALLIPAACLIRQIVVTQPIQGFTIAQWFDRMAQDDGRKIRASLYAGAQAGEGAAALVRRVLGHPAAAGVGGVTAETRRNLGTIAATAVQHASAGARQEFYKANAAILEDDEQFAAVLDGRTTRLCMSLNGNIYKRGVGPHPPLHMLCRSIRFAILSGEVLARMTPKRGLKRPVGGFPRTQNYEAWLRRQPVAVQNDILGRSRAILFRKGGVTLDKFVDYNGRDYSLAELAAIAPDVFKQAGLDPKSF